MADKPRQVTEPLPSDETLPPFEALRAFDAVGRLGGVRKAAQRLSRDHGAISRHLRTLEQWTHVRLIERTPWGTVLTPDGQRFHKQVSQAINSISVATRELMERHGKRRLCIRCMPGFALTWLSARLIDFERDRPDLEIEVRPTDFPSDVPTEHGDLHLLFAAAYSGAPPEPAVPEDYRSIDFAHAPIVAVASRDYLSKSTPFQRPADLLHHQLLHEEDFSLWEKWLAAHGAVCQKRLTGLQLWQGHLTLDAARRGRGIALTNALTASSDLKEQRLIEIGRGLPEFRPQVMGVWRLIAREDRWDDVGIDQFRRWLVARIAQEHPDLVPEITARAPRD